MSLSSDSKTVELKSSDDEVFRVEEALAKKSGLVRGLLEDRCGEEQSPIPLPEISGKMLRMAIEWITKHADEKLGEKELEEWEKKFVAVDMEVMPELLMAAHYLDLDDFLNRLCKKVAGIAAGRFPEELRILFKIPNDFTLDEELALRRENPWAFYYNFIRDEEPFPNIGY